MEGRLKLETKHGVDAGALCDFGRRLLEGRQRRRGLLGSRRSCGWLSLRLRHGGRRGTGSCDRRGYRSWLGSKLLEIGDITGLFRARLNSGK